jgi:hypothetical protein
MSLFKLLDKIDGTQELEIIETNSQRALYSGPRTHAPCMYEVVGIYTRESKIIIEVI